MRFARYSEYRTFTYNQSGFKVESRGSTDLLWLSKIGFIEIRKHRFIPEIIKQVIITKSKSGKWYATVTCDLTDVIMLPEIPMNSIGIDVGIKNFAYCSDGCSVENPHNLQKLLKPLKRCNKKISRRQPGSNRHKKAVDSIRSFMKELQTNGRISSTRNQQN